jgi:hypothetical protein
LRDDERALAVATPDQLMRLLTVCIRQDRFVEGASLGQAEGLNNRAVLGEAGGCQVLSGERETGAHRDIAPTG